MKKLFFPIYIFFLVLFLIFSYLFIDPNLSYLHSIYTGLSFNNRKIITIIYLFFVLLFFVLYFYILKNQKNIGIKKLIVATCGILFFSYPAMLSYDIFNYVATSKVLSFYKENPYIVMPIEFIGDPILSFTRAANKLVLYGPLWVKISGVSYVFGLNNFILTLFNFKLLILLFYLGTLILISRISKNRESVALFALSPLVVIETLVSSHNDIAMMFFVLLSFYLLMKKKLFLGSISIVASVLIKYSTIFLLPMFLYVIIKIIRKERVDWDRVFLVSSLSMMLIFFLSFFREEIYPWYAVWFLVFVYLVPQRKILLNLSIALSFGLLLSYIPYILLGTYSGQTAITKTILLLTPAVCFSIYAFFKKIIGVK